MSPAAAAPYSNSNRARSGAATPTTNKLRYARSYEFHGRTAQARRNESDVFNAWVRIARSGTPPTEAMVAGLVGYSRRFVRTILERLDQDGRGPLPKGKFVYRSNRLQHVQRTPHWERLRTANRSGPVPANRSARMLLGSKCSLNHQADDGYRQKTAKREPKPPLSAMAPKEAAKRWLVAQHAGKVTVQEVEAILETISERAAAAGTILRTAKYFIVGFDPELETLRERISAASLDDDYPRLQPIPFAKGAKPCATL